jgi:hypothetical protein
MLGGISESTLWKLVRHGELKVIRYGPRLTLFDVESLRAFLGRHSVSASRALSDAGIGAA